MRPLGPLSSDSDARRRPKSISVEASDTMSDGGVSSHQQLIVDLVIEPSHAIDHTRCDDDEPLWSLGAGSQPSAADDAGASRAYVTARPPTVARGRCPPYTGNHATSAHRVTSGRRSPAESPARSPIHSPRTAVLALSNDETTLSGSHNGLQNGPRRIRIIREQERLETRSLTEAELDDDSRNCEPRQTESTPATLLLEKLIRNAQAITDSNAAVKDVRPSAHNEAALMVQEQLTCSQHAVTGSQTQTSQPQHAVTGSQAQTSQPQHAVTGSQARQAVTDSQTRQGVTGSQAQKSRPRQAVTGSQARQGVTGSQAQKSRPRQAVTGSQTRQGVAGSQAQKSRPRQGVTGSQARQAVTGSQTRHAVTQNPPHTVTSSTAQDAVTRSLAQDAVTRSPRQHAIIKRFTPPEISRPGIMKVI